MKKYKNISWIFLLILPILSIISCSEMDDYKDFIDGGEIVYTGKIDTVTVFSGDGRVYIKGEFRSDPKVTLCRIYWNNKTDSMDVPVVRTDRTDTLKQYLTLPENMYSFEFRTFDNVGNRSVAVNAVGRSYGDAYKKSLNNRLVKTSVAKNSDTGDQVEVTWREIDKSSGAFTTKLSYTDNNGVTKNKVVAINDETTILDNYKRGTPFSYTTYFIPDTLCIDTFKSAVEVYTVDSYKINKKDWVATADSFEPTGQLPKGGLVSFVIDDDINTYWHTKHTDNGQTDYPHWLAFDMTKKNKVLMVELTTRADDNNGIKNARIEGRNSDSEEWVVYGYVRDLPNTKGESYQYPLDTPADVRYLRLYMTEGYQGQHTHLGEFSAYSAYD